MLNKRPIIIYALARGGSNIIMNLLLSHPGICISSGETHKVFKGTKWDTLLRRIKKRVCYDLPIRLLAGQDIFGAENYDERKKIPEILKRYIDHILYWGRFAAIIDTHNRYKAKGVLYTKEELGECRLLTKGLNGINFTVDIFKEMYPDAVFIALVRNGLALCEGYVRRGFSAENVGQIYNLVGRKMIESQEQVNNYYIVNYEEMVKKPMEFMQKIYEYSGLDFKELKEVRLQSKKIMDVSGQRSRLKGGDRQVFWYDLANIQQHIRSDINENQIKQLGESDKSKFLSIAGNVMEKFGYL